MDYNQLDISFGRFLASRCPEAADILFKAGRLVSQARREGNVCVLLQRVDPSMEHATLRQALWQTKVVGQAGEYCPLIIHGDYLYLHRYFTFETRVVDWISAASVSLEPPPKTSTLLAQLFPETGTGIDHQKQAALSSLSHSFSVISGGPGTGKTTTVAKILALHLSLNPELRIRLAAPTGKAATRLEESLAESCMGLDLQPEIKKKIGQPVQTIHRLLGFGRSGFQHNAEHPLAADLVLIDEASMVDLPLMADLMLALPTQCRLILLGDQYQLASVQPGAVLGEICAGKGGGDTEIPAIVTLEKSFRFKEESGIRRLADAIKKGDGVAALAILEDNRYPDVSLRPYASHELTTALETCFQGTEPEDLLAGFNMLGVLCCHRTGSFGVESINEQVMISHKEMEGQYYHGLPLMILANDHALGLYNGDTCVVVKQDKRFYGCFKTAEGLRMILVRKLPRHAPAYAITVHKSQGSEYAEVAFVLPEGSSRVLGRELVYTAVTRARKKVVIYGESGQFVGAVAQRVVRVSGLAERLAS